MNVPNKMYVTTKEYIQIQTKLNLYIAQYGCKAVERYLDQLSLKRKKVNNRNIGSYIIAKVKEEFTVTDYDLFESNKRSDFNDPRQMICLFFEKYMEMNKTDISKMFNKSRHFAKRSVQEIKQRISENNTMDREFIKRYDKLDMLIHAYLNFVPKTVEK